MNLSPDELCLLRTVPLSSGFIDPEPGNHLREIINYIENQNSSAYQTVNVNEPGNSVYRYTLLHAVPWSCTTLPLIVRARITRNTLRDPGSRSSNAISNAARVNVRDMDMNTDRADGNNDEVGHLIAYQNGGPNQPYNFAPQARNVNRGYSSSSRDVSVGSAWLVMENNINSWVRTGRGIVDQTIFVHYDMPSSRRPLGFSVILQNFLADGTKSLRTTYFITNDPTWLRDNVDMSITFDQFAM